MQDNSRNATIDSDSASLRADVAALLADAGVASYRFDYVNKR